jgi:uncharacterized protein (DUF1800 family)
MLFHPMTYVRLAAAALSLWASVALAQTVPRLVNLSSRAHVGTGDGVTIAGFVVGPGSGATVLIRAVGPSLAAHGVNGALVDPILSLHGADGSIIATNDNWDSADTATMNAVGAFPLLATSKDAAMVRTLAPGVYSAVVSGVNDTTGVGLLELYEVAATETSARLLNLSTRSYVGTGEDILITGLVVANGGGTRRLLVRAAGPALVPLHVSGALLDPTLRVLNASTGATVAANDDWGTPAFPGAADAATLNSVFSVWGATPFATGSKDAALIADFSPGLYTVNVSGVGNTTGVALLEVYDITPNGPPVVTITATRPTADQTGNNNGEFTLSRSGDVSQPLSVTYSFGGSATVGVNYTAGTGTIIIPQNSSTVPLPVIPRPDVLGSGTKTVVLTLTASSSAYSIGSPSAATVSISDAPALMYVANLRPVGGAANSTASGTATVLLSPDLTFAYVSVTFSNLSSAETVSYLRLGSGTDVGTELVMLNSGQVDSAYWGIQASGALSSADVLQALRDGHIFVSIETTAFPGGEIRGSFILSSGSQTFTAPPSAPPLDLSVVTDSDAARFLTQATFGPTLAEITALKQKGYSTWLSEQMAKPISLHRDATMADFAANNAGGQSSVNGVNTRPGAIHRQAAWWKIALTGDDQLRQRIAFALSEILVISDVNGTVNNSQEGTANYYDLLARDAFGSFRTLLEDVTLSPMMGIYLSHLRNARATSPTGAQPDENFAREVMQLFTIGLNLLQPDGTLKLDAQALPIPTYTQTTVTEMAKVFTGWSFHNTAPTNANFRNSAADYINPMTLYSGYHDATAKTIAGGTTLPANQTGTQDLQQTLDALFNHPNTGPFICRQLIQRLVTSSPSPAYVYRVAQVFADNGSGVRGDLGAVVRAILTDYEARSSTIVANDGFGKLKEPLLRTTSLLRANNVSSSTGRFAIANANAQLEQAALSAPSVFNFFEPYYVQPGSLASAGLYAPEFEILNATTAMSSANFLYNFIFNTSYQGVTLNFTDLLPLAAQPGRLVDQINLSMAGNQMSAASKTRIVAALSALPSSTAAVDRIRNALYLVTTTSEGAIQR